MNGIFNKEEFKQDKGNKIISTNKMYVMNAKPISPALLQGGMVKCNYILWFLSDKLKKGNKLQNLTIFRDVTYKDILIDSLIWQSQRVSLFCWPRQDLQNGPNEKGRDFVHLKVAHCPVANGGQLMHQHWSGQRCPISS